LLLLACVILGTAVAFRGADWGMECIVNAADKIDEFIDFCSIHSLLMKQDKNY
jgi:hypothetical protein